MTDSIRFNAKNTNQHELALKRVALTADATNLALDLTRIRTRYAVLLSSLSGTRHSLIARSLNLSLQDALDQAHRLKTQMGELVHAELREIIR